MRFRRVWDGSSPVVQIEGAKGWVEARKALAQVVPSRDEADISLLSRDVVALLGAPERLLTEIVAAARDMPPEAGQAKAVLMPFEPRSFRDFMIYERHAIDAARGFVREFMPRAWPFVRAYEAVTGTVFPRLRPKPLWRREPIYYMGNHLAFVTDGDSVAIPSYARALDYELELGFVLARGLFNVSPEEAEAAIGGVVVLNDFSARNVQLAEMDSGFGPQKSKHFANAISNFVVAVEVIRPWWRSLKGYVKINGELIAEPESREPRWSLGEMLAHASRSERLYPDEFFGTGTFPGGCGLETGRFLSTGDEIEIGIDGVGALKNKIIHEKDGAN